MGGERGHDHCPFPTGWGTVIWNDLCLLRTRQHQALLGSLHPTMAIIWIIIRYGEICLFLENGVTYDFNLRDHGAKKTQLLEYF
jgi:hypothetical protein